MNAVGIVILQLVIALLLAPLMPGIINRTKALVAGRHGQPLLQTWYDIVKLLGKGAVYSRTTSWLFRAGPTVGLAATAVALSIVPWAGGHVLLSFEGDLVLFCGLLALGRFATILAALDTGSAFEGMGASREAWFGSLGEPALFLALAAAVRGSWSISLSSVGGTAAGAALFLAAGAVFIVFLSENARIPVDDPTTHLELTMIHEVMALDHGGVDFAYIQYGASLKLWVIGGLFVSLLAPQTGQWIADMAIGLCGMGFISVATGVIESIMARLPLGRVPQLLVAAIAMSALALALALVR